MKIIDTNKQKQSTGYSTSNSLENAHAKGGISRHLLRQLEMPRENIQIRKKINLC